MVGWETNSILSEEEGVRFDAAALIREISATGLSSREGCGNTMRNVTGDPWAGVSAGELDL